MAQDAEAATPMATEVSPNGDIDVRPPAISPPPPTTAPKTLEAVLNGEKTVGPGPEEKDEQKQEAPEKPAAPLPRRTRDASSNRRSRHRSRHRSRSPQPVRKVVHKIEYRHVNTNNLVFEEESDRFAPSKQPPEEPVLEVIAIAFTVSGDFIWFFLPIPLYFVCHGTSQMLSMGTGPF
jgi:hypothetical protein